MMTKILININCRASDFLAALTSSPGRCSRCRSAWQTRQRAPRREDRSRPSRHRRPSPVAESPYRRSPRTGCGRGSRADRYIARDKVPPSPRPLSRR